MAADWRELCLSREVEELVLTRLRASELSGRMLAGVQRELVTSRNEGAGRARAIAADFIKTSGPQQLRHTKKKTIFAGFEVQLKNLVFHQLERLYHSQRTLPLLPPSLVPAEPLVFMKRGQEEWESRVRRRVNALATQFEEPLAKERSESEKQWIRKRWSGLGTNYPVPHGLYSILSPTELMDFLVEISSPNSVRNGDTSDGILMKVHLSQKSIIELRLTYSVLNGASPHVETCVGDGEAAYNEKICKVVDLGMCGVGREACKRGCSTARRRDLWSLATGLNITEEKHAFHFEKLKSSVFRTHIFLEKLLVKDVKETTANDVSYFVFEDTILQVLFAFLHDYTILDHITHTSMTPLKAYIPGGNEGELIAVVYPPSGLIPSVGLSFFVAPLCYVLDRPDHIYTMFKHLYLRYFIHLSCISSHPQGIVGLCGLFESLLHSRQPDLFVHLTSIGAPPLHLVFPWLVSGFASQLTPQELLLLWDRIIGFDSLQILSVFAVAALEFRAVNLFKATNLSEAKVMLADLRCLKVLPLLHQTLF